MPWSRAILAISSVLALGGCRSEARSDEASREAPPPIARVTSAGDPLAAEETIPLFVFVGSDGVTTLDGERLLIDRVIVDRAEAYRARTPHGFARVRCTHATLHGRLVRVLDLLREAEVPVGSVELVE